MTDATQHDAVAPNARRLLFAGFMAIFAAGVGFAIRGGILDNWQLEFGLNNAQVGVITGAGLTGFCFGIMIGGMVADKLGYGLLVIIAFALHIISAFVALSANKNMDPRFAAQLLFWGSFIFAIANGTLEAVANPLVATLFPKNRTHYLNILHASWPAGMILGGIAGWVLDDQYKVSWQTQLGLFLIPTVFYGILFLGQKMPRSEAAKQGLSLGAMLKDVGILGGVVACAMIGLFFQRMFSEMEFFEHREHMSSILGFSIGFVFLVVIAGLTNFSLGSPLLFILFLTHALVGAVELGTESWISNITGNILSSPEGKMLFVFTSLVMFGLRFTADFVEKKVGLSPVALLLVCAVLGCIGLNLTSYATTFVGAMGALAIYAIGKTFFWPTMLAVASDRFPRSGAIAISLMGGIGMMSAGLLGSAGLGYAKDRYAGQALLAANKELYQEFHSEKHSSFLFFEKINGIDKQKVEPIQNKLNELKDKAVAEGKPKSEAFNQLSKDEQTVIKASVDGDRSTLRADSFVPAAMAVVYLCLLIYFRTIGGYKAVHLESLAEPGPHHTHT